MSPMSDWLRSVVRTVMPGIWSVIVLWLAKVGLPDSAVAWLSSSDIAAKVVDLVALAVVYGFVRWVEPRLPDWATRILMGSAKAPTYTG
jgi:hypothetical protein